jgi:hypothetical protein
MKGLLNLGRSAGKGCAPLFVAGCFFRAVGSVGRPEGVLRQGAPKPIDTHNAFSAPQRQVSHTKSAPP